MVGSIERMARYLRVIRICCGYSMDAFAAEVGVSRQTIAHWENSGVTFTKCSYNAVSNVVKNTIKSATDTEYSEFLKRMLWMFVEGPYDEYICDSWNEQLNNITYSHKRGINDLRDRYIEVLSPVLDEIDTTWMEEKL